MGEKRLDERLSDEELELFVQYLHRFANHDVDISLNLEVGDPDSPVYVMFGRDYPPGRGRFGLSAAVRGPAPGGIRIRHRRRWVTAAPHGSS
ncbi:hypothetical protein [Streptomyces sp. NPDC090093]|uniref:hypothetical protein n=1 Tax=Streptomyces sp. NPDC090093 TaxID=3365945 RepID=UPI0037F5D40C